jgi:antitoxin component YwqK of YwqJK toxin-antitoxin module
MNPVFFKGNIKNAKKFTNLLERLAMEAKSKTKLVCVDIDNTLANVNAELEKLGYDISIYPNPYIDKNFWLNFEGQMLLLNAEIIKTTLAIISSIYTNFNIEIFFATTRPLDLIDITYAWLIKNNILSEVYFTQNKLQLDADIYIEDDPAVIETLLKNNKTVLVPRWEYNSHIEHPLAIHFSIKK